MTTMRGVIGSGTVEGLSRPPEQFADAPSLVDAHDRLCDQWRDGQDAELGGVVETVTAVVIRDRVGDADLVDRGCMESRHRAVTQYAVRRDHVDRFRATGEERDRGVDQRATGRDQVVNDNADRAVDITDDVDDLDGVVTRTAFVDERYRCVEDAREVASAVHPTGIR